MDTSNEDKLRLIFAFIVIILFIVVAISWIIMIVNSFKLHTAYKAGKAGENICGEFYLEGESARAKIYETYIGNNKDGVENQLKNIFNLFFWLLTVLMILIILFVAMVNKTIYNNISGVTLTLGYGLMIGGLITLITLWLTFYYKNDESNTINPFSGVLFRVGEKLNDDIKSNLLKRQIGMLIGIATTIVILQYYISNYTSNEYYKTVMSSVWTIFIVTSLFIIYITNTVYELNVNINGYYGGKINTNDKTGLNYSIRENLTNTLFSNNLRNNIKALDNLSETPSTLTKEETNPYYNKLYRYVLNGVNMAEIRNIVIPEELYEIINPIYLTGENIITLKYDFLRFYNSLPSTRKTNFDNYVKIYLKDEFKKASIFDNSFNCDTLALCGSGGGSLCVNGVNCNKVKSLVERFILQNDSYKLNNTIPIEIRSLLQDLRKDTIMEDTVVKYFNSMNQLSIVLFIIIGYLLFHKMYQANREKFTGIVSIIMICLLLVIGAIGWFFKDLWL